VSAGVEAAWAVGEWAQKSAAPVRSALRKFCIPLNRRKPGFAVGFAARKLTRGHNVVRRAPDVGGGRREGIKAVAGVRES